MNIMKLLGRARAVLCRWFGHRWRYPSSFIRECTRCPRKEAVYINRFPHIGEPQYEWRLSPKIVTPRFTKDVDELRTWPADILPCLLGNAIGDVLAESALITEVEGGE